MKKLLLLIGLVFIFSCEKDTYCFICERTTTYTTFNMTPEVTKFAYEVCDKTLTEIQQMEKEQSITLTIRFGPDRYATTEKILKCKVNL